MKIRLLFFALFFLPVFLLGQDQASADKIKEIVHKIDDLYRSNTSYAEMEMQIVTPHWERTLKMKAWTEGLNKTFIRILEPAKERGVATLRVDREMWNYLPKTNKVMKIPPSMMMSSWMGSDFTNDDLVNEFNLLDDYQNKLISPDSARSDLYYIQSIPNEGLPVVWSKIEIAVRKSDYIPVQEKYYDDKDQLMRIFYYHDIKMLGGRMIPAVMEVVPQNKEGQKTVLRYLDAAFNIKLPADTFTLRNLHSQ